MGGHRDGQYTCEDPEKKKRVSAVQASCNGSVRVGAIVQINFS